jgi:ABC-type transport system involved in cytochrome c biogenesis permease subunit
MSKVWANIIVGVVLGASAGFMVSLFDAPVWACWAVGINVYYTNLSEMNIKDEIKSVNKG